MHDLYDNLLNYTTDLSYCFAQNCMRIKTGVAGKANCICFYVKRKWNTSKNALTRFNYGPRTNSNIIAQFKWENNTAMLTIQRQSVSNTLILSRCFD